MAKLFYHKLARLVKMCYKLANKISPQRYTQNSYDSPIKLYSNNHNSNETVTFMTKWFGNDRLNLDLRLEPSLG